MTDFAQLREYGELVAGLKARIEAARLAAARSVNRELILLYWDIGGTILDAQKHRGWGDAVIETLARDLKTAFPEARGFSARNLWEMRRFFAASMEPEFLQQAVAELSKASDTSPVHVPRPAHSTEEDRMIVRNLVAKVPWGQHLLILNKTTTSAARLYYITATARFGWSRNVLLNQIKAGAYERSLAEGKSHNFPAVMPEYLAEQAEEAMKSSYNLEFLGIRREIRERDLEERLTTQLQDFILELGYGFCFIGRQYRLRLGGNEYFIDLLFYHRFLRALVAIELKIGRFTPEHAGKMDFYLNLLNETERAQGDNPSIGIILCAERNRLEVEFALKTKTNPIGVAEYHLQPTLPEELAGKLPSSDQLDQFLAREFSDPEDNP
ncbi:MAG: DUF1016 family protein [Candidatus Sumerlaeia bacterium]|nr:DUF1016 family protein [Candidatus Sumerlaeia bacterium]